MNTEGNRISFYQRFLYLTILALLSICGMLSPSWFPHLYDRDGFGPPRVLLDLVVAGIVILFFIVFSSMVKSSSKFRIIFFIFATILLAYFVLMIGLKMR
jgi:thiosulfate reductase cytochrome b subunit